MDTIIKTLIICLTVLSCTFLISRAHLVIEVRPSQMQVQLQGNINHKADVSGKINHVGPFRSHNDE